MGNLQFFGVALFRNTICKLVGLERVIRQFSLDASHKGLEIHKHFWGDFNDLVDGTIVFDLDGDNGANVRDFLRCVAA